MNCRAFEKLISEYYDGTCQSQKLYAFEGHASVCNDCQERLNEWAKLSLLVKEMAPIKAPEDFEASLMRKIKNSPMEDTEPGFYKPFGLARIFAYAMGLVIVAVSLLMLQNMTSYHRDLNPATQPIDLARDHPADKDSSLDRPQIPTDDQDFMEVLLKGTGDQEVIMRLPATIRVNSSSINEDYYLRNVSH